MTFTLDIGAVQDSKQKLIYFIRANIYFDKAQNNREALDDLINKSNFRSLDERNIELHIDESKCNNFLRIIHPLFLINPQAIDSFSGIAFFNNEYQHLSSRQITHYKNSKTPHTGSTDQEDSGYFKFERDFLEILKAQEAIIGQNPVKSLIDSLYEKNIKLNFSLIAKKYGEEFFTGMQYEKEIREALQSEKSGGLYTFFASAKGVVNAIGNGIGFNFR